MFTRFPYYMEVLMGEVPGSLTELKIYIGKNILINGMSTMPGSSTDHQAVIDLAPDFNHTKTAERWRAAYPKVAEKVGWVAERALAELQKGDILGAISSITSDRMMIEAEFTDIERGNSSIYLSPILNNLFSVKTENTIRCLEALVAYGRGE